MSKSHHDTSVIPNGYIRLDEATAKLGCSKATIERLRHAGRLHVTQVKREKRKPELVYLEADVDAQREQREQRRELRPPSATTNSLAVTAAPRRTEIGVASEAMDGFAKALREAFDVMKAPSVEHKLWLTIAEAAQLSGRTQAWLLAACQRGTLVAEKDGGWKIQRLSLETYQPQPQTARRPAKRAASARA